MNGANLSGIIKGEKGGLSVPDSYIPPFTMTDAITNLVIEIAELTGAMTVSEQLSKNLKLRRDNRIKSIHSSLAIEQNTLTEEQVSDVIDGTQSAAGLAEIVGASPRTVQRALKRLMDDGKIEQVGSNRFGHYIVK